MNKFFQLFAKKKRSVRQETIRKFLTPGSIVRVVPGKSFLNSETLKETPKDKAKGRMSLLWKLIGLVL
jgi:hypothetical protein